LEEEEKFLIPMDIGLQKENIDMIIGKG